MGIGVTVTQAAGIRHQRKLLWNQDIRTICALTNEEKYQVVPKLSFHLSPLAWGVVSQLGMVFLPHISFVSDNYFCHKFKESVGENDEQSDSNIQIEG